MTRRRKLMSGLLLVGAMFSQRAEAQNANPYSGAAGFLYSQGRVAAPGQVGGPLRPRDAPA